MAAARNDERVFLVSGWRWQAYLGLLSADQWLHLQTAVT